MDPKEVLKLSLLEDAPFGDITSEGTVSNFEIEGIIVSKGEGVMASKVLFEAVRSLFPSLHLEGKIREGDEFIYGDVIAEIKGPAKDVLLVERTLLNILSRMCGIAKLTREFVKRSNGVPIYDTRKTMPLLRYFDKYAVRVGGGYNHRFTLSEIGMIKDNHKRLAGSISEAVRMFRAKFPHVPLIVEVESIEEIKSLKGLSVDWVLLDNMDIDSLKRAIPIAKDMGFKVEVSGGINLENVSDYAALKPDRISVGALTKAAPPVDISLEVRR